MEGREAISEEHDRIAKAVVNAAFQVHWELGPGLLESAYEACLCYELSRKQLPFRSQVALPIVYQGLSVDAGYRLDLVVGDKVVVELKAVDRLERTHTAQLLTYLRLSHYRLGLRINFNVTKIRDGIKRYAL